MDLNRPYKWINDNDISPFKITGNKSILAEISYK